MQTSNRRSLPNKLFQAIRSGTLAEMRHAMQACSWSVNEEDDQGLTLFFYAIFHERFELAEALLTSGANPDYQDPQGWTPVFWATYNQKQACLRFLLAHGASPNVRNQDGEWPLFWAVFQGNPDIVSLLLLGGADLSWTDDDGLDVICLAQSLGKESLLAQLKAFRPH